MTKGKKYCIFHRSSYTKNPAPVVKPSTPSQIHLWKGQVMPTSAPSKPALEEIKAEFTELISRIVKAVVNTADAVTIETTISDVAVIIVVTTKPDEIGQAIGKDGGIAKAMRRILSAAATKYDMTSTLRIMDA